MNEGYQINVIYPFVVFMMRDFGITEDLVGLYSGLLTATFALCQFISSYFWGHLSDIYGRRIALMVGLIVSAFAIIIFGTSKTYAQAIIARSISGIFNGNIGVARAFIADITNGNNRAFAFSIFAIAFSGGIIVGSTAGGLLVHTYDLNPITKQHQPSHGIWQFWIFDHEYPYLLPCVVGALITCTAFVLTFLYITDIQNVEEKEETIEEHNDKIRNMNMDELQDYISSKGKPSYSHSLPMVSISMEGVAFRKKSIAMYEADHSEYEKAIMNESQVRAFSVSPKKQPLTFYDSMIATSISNDTHNALHEGLKAISFSKKNRKLNERNKLLHDGNMIAHETEVFSNNRSMDSSSTNVKIDSLHDLFSNTKLGHTLIVNATLFLFLVGWNAMSPLLLTQSKLEFSSTEIGIFQAYSGLTLLVFTWVVQPWFLKTFQHKMLFIVNGICILALLIIFPSIPIIPGITSINRILLLIVVSLIGSLKFIFSTFLFVISICYVNNSVPAHVVGRANGLAQAFGSGLRGLGPLIGGSLWSWSMTLQSVFAIYIAYAFMFIFQAFAVVYLVFYIPAELQKTWEEREEQRKQNNY